MPDDAMTAPDQSEEMIEAVAEAIYADTWDEPFPIKGGIEYAHSMQVARAAIEALRPFREAAEAKAREDAWQPIETAPRDWTAVLLYKPDEPRSGEYILAGYWGEWPGKDECWIAVGGQPLGWFSSVIDAPQGYPTHWRPLPAPPALEQGDAK